MIRQMKNGFIIYGGIQMKYTLTSSEASKLLRKINEEKVMILSHEEQTYKFNAAVGEDIEAIRPDYDYTEVSQELDKCDAKIRAIKHAINAFNTTTIVGDTGMTIDEVLVYLPQLSEKKNKLSAMQRRLPMQRASVVGSRTSTIIDYTYINYDLDAVKNDYIAVSDELRKIQTALDLVNTTVAFDIEIEE